MSTRGHLVDKIKMLKIQDHTTAATSAVTSDAVDMQGYEGVLIFSSFGTAAAGNTIKLQQSDDDGATDAYSDLEGTSVSSGTSDEDVWIDCYKPAKRYIKAVFARGTSSTLESVWAIRYDARTLAVSNVVSGTIIGEKFVTPAEGTA
jgi:hypothetical protein